MDASKNIKLILRYASKSLKRPTEPRRSKEKRRDPQRNRPFDKAVPLENIKPANMTASYETYKQKSSDIRPASRIMRQWDAPVALRPPQILTVCHPYKSCLSSINNTDSRNHIHHQN